MFTLPRKGIREDIRAPLAATVRGDVKGMITYPRPPGLSLSPYKFGSCRGHACARRYAVSQFVLRMWFDHELPALTLLPTPCTAPSTKENSVADLLDPSHKVMQTPNQGTSQVRYLHENSNPPSFVAILGHLFLHPTWPAKPVLKQRQPASTRRLTAVTGAVVQGLTHPCSGDFGNGIRALHVHFAL